MSSPLRLDRLRVQLLAFQSADPLERGYRDEMLQLCAAEGDPFSRSHFVPGHFTASAFLLSPDESALMLIYHRKLKRWLQPGGHIEPEDADIVAAARREVGEEVWVFDAELLGPAPFDLDVHRIPKLGDEASHCHFDVRVLFRARSWQVKAGEEVGGARWMPLENIDELESDASVMRAVRKLIARQ